MKRVVAIVQVPVWRMQPVRIRTNAYRASLFNSPALAAQSLRSGEVEPAAFAIDARLRKTFTAAGADFVSPLDTLCDDGGCLVVVPGTGEPFAWDDSHLTVKASLFYMDAIGPSLLPRHAERQ